MAELPELVLESSLGKEMTEEEAARLAGLMSERRLADGEFLTVEGTADDSLHVLLAGRLEVVKNSGAGETASLALLREGDIAGELSFVDGESHSVGLRAVGECRVLSLNREDFEKAVENHPQLAYKVMRAVVRSAHKVLRRMNFEFVELSNYIFKQHGRY